MSSQCCPCIEEPVHRREVGVVDVAWTDTPGCPCQPWVSIALTAVNLQSAKNVAGVIADLQQAVPLMAQIEATAPGSPERARLHDRCTNHRCAAPREETLA